MIKYKLQQGKTYKLINEKGQTIRETDALDEMWDFIEAIKEEEDCEIIFLKNV